MMNSVSMSKPPFLGDNLKKGKVGNGLIHFIKYPITIFILLFCTFLPYTQVNATTGYQNLPQQLNQVIMKEPTLQGAIAGISVRSGQNGTILYDYQEMSDYILLLT